MYHFSLSAADGEFYNPGAGAEEIYFQDQSARACGYIPTGGGTKITNVTNEGDQVVMTEGSLGINRVLDGALAGISIFNNTSGPAQDITVTAAEIKFQAASRQPKI